MDDRPTLGLLDSNGRPLAAHVERVLRGLLPRLRRQFPALQDEVTLTEVMEEAGRRIAGRETRSGPIEKLYGYAWVTLRSVATSRARLGSLRVIQNTLPSEASRSRLTSVAATSGTPHEIEQRILFQEAMAMLSPEEQRICNRKAAGFSSQEIAKDHGRSVTAIDAMFSRAKDKVRRAMGVHPVEGGGGPSPAQPPRAEAIPGFDEEDTETDDGTPTPAT